MKKTMKRILIGLCTAVLICMTAFPVFAAAPAADADADKAASSTVETQADNQNEDSSKGDKAIGAAIAVGLAAAAGAIGMGIAVGKSTEGISRQPEAEGKIRTTLMLGLVFIETAIIYALIIAILVIFVL